MSGTPKIDAMLEQFESEAAGLPDAPKPSVGNNGTGRNVELTRVAGHLTAQGISNENIRARVFERNAQFPDPLDECEVEGILRSAEKWEKPADRNALPEHIEDTDLGNAKAFADYVTGHLLWDGTNGQWWWWDRSKWIPDIGLQRESYLEPVINRLYQQAALMEGERRDRRLKFLTSRLKSRQAQVAMMEGARPYLPVSPTQFDAEPHRICFNNGVLDLLTGDFGQPAPGNLNSKTTGFDYRGDAKSPRWLESLNEIAEGDSHFVQDLQLIFGESLSGDTGKSLFIIYWGEGANGKSTVLKVHAHMLGDYAAHTKSSVFAARDSENVKGWDIHPLVGARLVTAVETDSTRYLNEATVKNMTGDDRMRAEKKYGMSFEFNPTWLPIMATNSKPRTRGTNEALWRRLRLVEFNYRIPEANRVKGYADKFLSPELAGIFNWAYEGFMEIQAAGEIKLSTRVITATRQYRDNQDVLAEWLEQRTVADSESRTLLKDAFADYTDFMSNDEVVDGRTRKVADKQALGRRSFQEAMEERGFRTIVGQARARYLTGLKLTGYTDQGEL